MNEADISRLKDIDQLKSFIKEQIPDIDVDYLTARLRRQPEEHVLKTMQSLAQFADTRNPALLEPLRFKTPLISKVLMLVVLLFLTHWSIQYQSELAFWRKKLIN